LLEISLINQPLLNPKIPNKQKLYLYAYKKFNIFSDKRQINTKQQNGHIARFCTDFPESKTKHIHHLSI